MPVLLTLFGAFLKFFALYAITRLLLALGLSYVMITGFSDLIAQAEGAIQTEYGQLPSDVYQIVTMAGADVALTILFSALSIRFIMNGLSQGVIATMAFRRITSGN